MTDEKFEGNPEMIVPQLGRLRALFEKQQKRYAPIAGATLLFYSRRGTVSVTKSEDTLFSVRVRTSDQGTILFDIDVNGVRIYDANLNTPTSLHFTLDQILDELESK